MENKPLKDLTEFYFGEENPVYYKSHQEQIGSWVRFVDMLLAALLIRKQNGEILLSVPGEREDAFVALEKIESADYVIPEFTEIMEKIFECGAELYDDGVVLPLNDLILKLRLNPFEIFCVVLAFAVERDRKYEAVFNVLGSSSEIKKPTLGLAYELFSMVVSLDYGEAFFFSHCHSNCSKFLFESFADKPEQSRLAKPLSLNKMALYYLADTKLPFDEIPAFCEFFPAASMNEEVLCHEDEINICTALINSEFSLGSGKQTCLLNLHGPDGSGRRFILRKACADLSLDVIVADCTAFLKMPLYDMRKQAGMLAGYSILSGAVLCLNEFNITRENQDIAREMLKFLSQSMSFTAIISNTRMIVPPPDTCVYHGFEVKSTSFEEQRGLWNYFANVGGYTFNDDVDIEKVISTFDLPAGHIKDVLQLAQIQAAVNEGVITHRNICDAIREKNRVEISAFAELMRTEFTWGDLVLGEESVNMLQKVCNRVLYKRVVNDKWGMGRKLPYGRGLSVVLYGPPGTGKTMAAQVIANEIGRDIYRIDLSRMISKYIGETEKNLGEVFDAAQNVNAVLFFDEADALFTKRTEVKEARDKYANTETSYLLQKIEAYNGITVLATNNASNFDVAFKRRINYFVNIEMPNPEERLKLWQSLITEKMPLDDSVNISALARKFELSGSEIKSALIEAAYAAAAGNSRITQEMLLTAISDEYKKSGRIIFKQDMR
ncbi:MAG: AAA family ATPase [Oscillospiraceae bacterium]|nr:AAA family ATPase [Oscillospiraceae bacterium]